MARFFGHGRLDVTCADRCTRQVAINICMPCYTLQTCTPVLLGFGLMDRLTVHQPVTAWMLFPDADGYPSHIIEKSPDLPDLIRKSVESKIKDILDAYVHLTKVMEDPSLALMMLPLGVYVEFRYRCEMDDIASMLVGLAEIKVAGVPEFQFAMAQTLAEILQDSGDVIVGASTPKLSP